MSDAAWTTMGLIGVAVIGLFSTMIVQLAKLASEILGKKKEESLREMLKRYHSQNTDKIRELERGFGVLHRDINEVKSTIKRLHPGEAI